MPTYKVTLKRTITETAYVLVEADHENSAIVIAEEEIAENDGTPSAAKRKAKGYRTKRNLKAVVYLIAGDVLANSPT